MTSIVSNGAWHTEHAPRRTWASFTAAEQEQEKSGLSWSKKKTCRAIAASGCRLGGVA
jgi:hypothetical protein